jgi:hypothetical protein
MRSANARPNYALLVALLPATLAACGRPADSPPPVTLPPAGTMAPAASTVRVTEIALGKAVGADKRISQRAEQFAAGDTIYASVSTDGSSPSTTIRARWTFEGGQLVDEATQTIAPTGPTVTEFHISKPDGWPKGGYEVEVFVDGASAGKRRFTVS